MTRSLLLLGVLLLGACSWFSSPPMVKPWLPMLAPADLERSLAALQKVSGERDGQQYVMLFQLEIDARHLAMVGSTVGGNTLFSLEYRDGKVNTSVSPLVPAQIDPAWVLADLQLVFWPQAAIERALAGSAFSLASSPGLRELYYRRERLIRVEYSSVDPWRGPVTLKNDKFDYEYRIETLRQELLPATGGAETLVF